MGSPRHHQKTAGKWPHSDVVGGRFDADVNETLTPAWRRRRSLPSEYAEGAAAPRLRTS
jgi:hypothetical protein